MKWPPGKETGALLHAPKTDAAPEYSRCEHNSTRVQLLSPGSVHHGKEVCTSCDRFLRWVPKPKTIATSYPLKTAGSSTAPSNSKRFCSQGGTHHHHHHHDKMSARAPNKKAPSGDHSDGAAQKQTSTATANATSVKQGASPIGKGGRP
jgi:hypothetical protein